MTRCEARRTTDHDALWLFDLAETGAKSLKYASQVQFHGWVGPG